MTRSRLTWLLLLTLAVPVGGSDSSDKAAVLDRLQKACDSFVTGDAAYLADFLDPEFTLTDSQGAVTTREQTLAEVRSREPRYEVFRNHGMKVRLYGAAAVVNGITSLKGTAGGKPFEVDVQFTDTLVKRDGQWRLAASHVSRK
jgi:hypothetical protein